MSEPEKKPRTMLRTLGRLASILAFLAAAWCLWTLILAVSKGYSLKEMDWNHDGRTTIGEVWKSADIVRIQV
jgi:hypothetical protein